MEQNFLSQYQIFLKKGSVDLATAELVHVSFVNGNVELDEEVILFHLQQCAEKFMKALLDFNRVSITRTHDLYLLAEKLEDAHIAIPFDFEPLLRLNQFAVDGRYSVIPDTLKNIEEIISLLNDFERYLKEIFS